MEEKNPLNRIMLWSAPRCLSSAFERAVRELQDVKTIYHPHTGPYFYGPERRTESFFHLYPEIEKRYAAYTYDYADKKLLANYSNFIAVFAKSMAYSIPMEKYETYTQGKFSVYKHTFLIRNPRLSVPSFWRVCKKNGYDFPGVLSIASQSLWELFEHVRSKTNQELVVVDACDLLRDPGATLSQYCQKTGLNYSEGMLTWKPGIVEDWTEYPLYKEWHGDAMLSSGFSRGFKKEQVEETFPPEVEEEIQKAMPYYEAMSKYCLIVP